VRLPTVTLTAAVPEVNPADEAVIVAVPVVRPAVTWKVVELLFAGTVTVAGTDATAVLLLERVTVWPFAPAAELSVTVMFPVVLPESVSGLGESDTAAEAVMLSSSCTAGLTLVTSSR
jgi:hypothetical protein